MPSIRHRRIFQYNSELGYKFIPNLNLFWDYRIKTNKEGFRDNLDFEDPTRKGKVSILALGDSYLAGDGVSNEERFSDIVAGKLNLSILNTGLPGSGTDQQLIIQEKIAGNLEYDALLYAPYVHNIQRNMMQKVYWTKRNIHLEKPYFTLQNGNLQLHNSSIAPPQHVDSVETALAPISTFRNQLPPLVKKIAQSLKNNLLGIKYKYFAQSTRDMFSPENITERPLMKALAQKIITNAGNKPIFILPIPDREHVLYKAKSHYLTFFKELAQENKNVQVIDILPLFNGKNWANASEIYNTKHGHFTSEVNKQIAQIVEPIIGKISRQAAAAENINEAKAAENRSDSFDIGISCYYHDSAAAILKNGEIVAACHEERFTRKKHDKNFPFNALKYCLEEADISVNQIGNIVYYDDPYLSLDRVLVNLLSNNTTPDTETENVLLKWMNTKFALRKDLEECIGYKGPIFRSFHHRSHAASAFYPSPYKEAAIVIVDGVGEWASSSIGVGYDNKVEILCEQNYPHSIGLLYSAFTSFCGFKVNSGEYKLMGLAPYGNGLYTSLILENMLQLKDDGSFILNMNYFSFMEGEKMYSDKFTTLFGVPPRKSESPLTQVYMDIAKSIQEVTEIILLKLTTYAHKLTGKDYLVMAGGVALNCVANGKLLKESPFKDIWIQPASGDAGGAIGAAMDLYYNTNNNPRGAIQGVESQTGSLYGPSYSNVEIKAFLDWENHTYHELHPNVKADTIAKHIADGKVIGFFTGRTEYGPRALGARSIIADARNVKMQTTLNLKIKYRESFRPFAPIVLEEDVSEYFELDRPSPYMLMVQKVVEKRRLEIPKELLSEENFIQRLNSPRSDIPAVTHLDYSARIQTVSKTQNKELYHLLRAFKDLTGYGVLVNTSFNVRGEPIVCTPEDAYRCFMRTEMDILVLENMILYKEEQRALTNDEDWKNVFDLD